MSANTSTAPAAARYEEPDPRNSLRHVLAIEPSPEAQPQEFATPARPASNSVTNEEEDKAASAEARMDVIDQNVPMYTATTTTVRRNANGSVSSVYSGNKIRHLKKEDGQPLWRRDIQYDFLRMVFEDDKKVFHKMSDGTAGHTFADIYLDAMAKSSKCSKILKDKLLTERPAAVNMAMVCLLVNVGRMNTTLNFFPEMRAQLRTYHSIPSLQAHQDPNSYKQLQDAPRLKSILKGATEDTEQPSTLEDIKAARIPRTNPVNLIFVLAQYAPKISEVHFDVPRDFFDLVMKSGLSSRSRATAFLWLMWWYLESNFSKHDALNNPYGPGQMGKPGDATGGLPLKCPPFEYLTEEQAALENVDTPDEMEFGEVKRKERAAILASDMVPVVAGPRRGGPRKGFISNTVFSVASDEGTVSPARDYQSPAPGPGTANAAKNGHRGRSLAQAKPHDNHSDTDRTRSVSPPAYQTSFKATPSVRINALLNDDAPATSTTPTALPPKGPGRGNWRRNNGAGASSGRSAGTFRAKPDAEATDAPSPGINATSTSSAPLPSGPHGFYLPLNGADPSHKRSRPLTAHQLAVESYRKEKVGWILDRGLRKSYQRSRTRRVCEGAFARAWVRARALPDGYDSEEEMLAEAVAREEAAQKGEEVDRAAVMAGWAGVTVLGWEGDDWGEEASARAKGLGRAARRLERWEGGLEPVRRKRRDVSGGAEMGWGGDEGEEQDEDERGNDNEVGDAGGGDVLMEDEQGEEEMDEFDREILREADGEESEDEIGEGDNVMVGGRAQD